MSLPGHERALLAAELLTLERRIRRDPPNPAHAAACYQRIVELTQRLQPLGKSTRRFQRIPVTFEASFEPTTEQGLFVCRATEFSLGGFRLIDGFPAIPSPVRLVNIYVHGQDFAVSQLCELVWNSTPSNIGLKFVAGDQLSRGQIFDVFDHVYLCYLADLAGGGERV